jgi:hypothetical protein
MTIDEIYAICGPKCTECDAYKATRASKMEVERISNEWTKSLGKLFTAEDIICDGCRVKNGRLSAYCAECEIRKCALSRNVETCGHCEKSPCEKIVAPPAIEAIERIKNIIR